MDWYPAWIFLIFCKAMSHFFYIVRCILHVLALKVYSIYYSYSSKQVVHYSYGGRSWYANYDMAERFIACQYMSQEKWQQKTQHLRPILLHDDIIKRKHFPHYWPFMWVTCEFPHKDQWCGALMCSLICAWTNEWLNNRGAVDLRRHRAHYDVAAMIHWARVISQFKRNISSTLTFMKF